MVMRPWVWFCLVLSLGLGAGCRMPMGSSLFTSSGPEWRVSEGQAIWRPGRKYPELAGEIVVAQSSNGCCSVQFTKTPLPLVLAQTSPTNWLIQFPPANMCFGGRGQPPTRFAWLYLHRALAGEPLPPKLRFQRKPDGGWRLENVRTGETLEGFLTP